jgi:voltage-gated potassium channel
MSHAAPATVSVPERADERAERIARWFEVPVLVAALLTIPVLAIEQSGLGDPWASLAEVLNWLVWTVFLVELVTMLAVVPSRWAWLRGHTLELAIVTLTPPFLPASLQALRVFRLLRLLPLLRLASLTHRSFPADGVRHAALLALLAVLGGGAAFAAAEGSEVSTWDGLWWSVTTMTTTGYGDVVPQTGLGRAIAIVVMLSGIGFIAILTAALAERLVRRRVIQETEIVAKDVEDSEAAVVLELREITQRLKALEEQLSARARGSV